MSKQYHYQIAKETFERILAGTTPWVAVGDFLDDWRRMAVRSKPGLMAEPIADAGEDLERQRWAAFLAATVEWLCWQGKLPFPAWTSKQEYLLRDAGSCILAGGCAPGSSRRRPHRSRCATSSAATICWTASSKPE